MGRYGEQSADRGVRQLTRSHSHLGKESPKRQRELLVFSLPLRLGVISFGATLTHAAGLVKSTVLVCPAWTLTRRSCSTGLPLSDHCALTV
jgi:hypothetical protein